jgi:hypothetical protein
VVSDTSYLLDVESTRLPVEDRGINCGSLERPTQLLGSLDIINDFVRKLFASGDLELWKESG